MPIAINGSGTITGVSVGGLPDGIVDTDMIAADAVTDAKQSLSGAAKAWVSFNGTGTVAITDSFNVSSITDNGTGNYTVNLTNNMTDTNYCVVTSNSNSTTASQSTEHSNEFSPTLRTTGSFRIRSGNTENNSNSDSQAVNVVVFGS